MGQVGEGKQAGNAKPAREGFGAAQYLLFAAVCVAVFILCVCVGSVDFSPADIFAAAAGVFTGVQTEGAASAVIVAVRFPRVLCVALVGAALSICGAGMQGLLRNPLADGSTLGVSSGASLGAVLAIAVGFSIPGLPGMGTALAGILFAFLSLMCILALAHKLDYSLSTNTIILIGVIFSMFANSVISLCVTFAGERLRSVVFWTMGSLDGAGYQDVLLMFAALAICGVVILLKARELNAFAVGEDNARNVGIDVKRVKTVVMVAVSVLIGVAVSIGGSIGFVGLVIPHIMRMLVGPNHRRLLPASLFGGAAFLMLADLVARTLLRPRTLPIGVVTSIIGAVMFIFIFYRTSRAAKSA